MQADVSIDLCPGKFKYAPVIGGRSRALMDVSGDSWHLQACLLTRQVSPSVKSNECTVMETRKDVRDCCLVCVFG